MTTQHTPEGRSWRSSPVHGDEGLVIAAAELEYSINAVWLKVAAESDKAVQALQSAPSRNILGRGCGILKQRCGANWSSDVCRPLLSHHSSLAGWMQLLPRP